MKRKIVITVLTILSISLACVGCGNGETKQNTSGNSSISQSSSNFNIQGTWSRSDGDLSFSGGDSGTYSFDSTGMYDDTGTYSIASDGTITFTSSKTGESTVYEHVTIEELKDGTRGWCIENDTLHWGYYGYDFIKK